MEFGFRHAAAGSVGVGALTVLFLLYSLFLLTWRLHLLFLFFRPMSWAEFLLFPLPLSLPEFLVCYAQIIHFPRLYVQ